MLEIVRSKNWENYGDASSASRQAIAEVEVLAGECFIEFVRENGGSLVANDYYASITRTDQLEDQDLKPYVETGEECLVFCTEPDYEPDCVITSYFDLKNKRGAQKAIGKYRDDPFEIYELDKSYIKVGENLILKEIFDPGSRPELSNFVAERGKDIVIPEELPIRITTIEEGRQMRALARLSMFELEHFAELERIYAETCFPTADYRPPVSSESTAQHYHHAIVGGEDIGLRTRTEYVAAAKHQFYPDKHGDQLMTYLYLNYDIAIGPERFMHFEDDIAMCVDYGQAAQEYFYRQGIGISVDLQK